MIISWNLILKIKNLHVGQNEKFIPSFIELIRSEMPSTNNRFFIYGRKDKFGYENGPDNIDNDNKYTRYLILIFAMYRSERVILHGLFEPILIYILFFNPWLISKCYWVIWGGDLYGDVENQQGCYNKVFRNIKISVKSRIKNVITYIKGDVKLFEERYGTKPKMHYCLMYMSNTFRLREKGDSIPLKNIILGNSSDRNNKHIESLEMINSTGIDEIVDNIVCPLSYGSKAYAKEVSDIGIRLFPDKFKALTKFISLDEYYKILDTISVVIFAHERQQAMGNTINLIGMGKKVYLKNNTSQYELLKGMGIKVFDYNSISKETLYLFPSNYKENNMKIISTHFSKGNLVKQWESILSI